MNEKRLSVNVRKLIEHYTRMIENGEVKSEQELVIYYQILSELRNAILISSI